MADRVGIMNVIVVVTWAWCIVAFCWLGVSKVSGYYVFTVFYGITSGSFQSMNPTAVTRITKRLDMVGTRLGSKSPGAQFAPPSPFSSPDQRMHVLQIHFGLMHIKWLLALSHLRHSPGRHSAALSKSQQGASSPHLRLGQLVQPRSAPYYSLQQGS